MPRAALCLLLLAAPATAQAPKKPSEFALLVNQHYAKWDKDKNGELSVEEIDAQIVNPAVKGPPAAAVAAMKNAVRASQKPDAKKLPPFTREYLLTTANTNPPPADAPKFNSLYGSCLRKIGTANRVLFVDGKPELREIDQGRMGDCFCLAPLGAAVARDPKAVKEMFQKNPDGSYTVTLGKEKVKVAPLTDGEFGLSSDTGQNGMWVNLYEKALGEFRNSQKSEDEKGKVALDAISSGGSTPQIQQLLTGHKSERVLLAPLRDEKKPEAERTAKLAALRKRLTESFEKKRLVTCGTAKTLPQPVPGVVAGHAYAVLGYDEKADRIRIWNPHNNTFTPKGSPGPSTGYLTKGGIFEMPFAEFAALFSGVTFETDKPVGG